MIISKTYLIYIQSAQWLKSISEIEGNLLGWNGKNILYSFADSGAWHLSLLSWIYSLVSISQYFPSPSGLKFPGSPPPSLPFLALPSPTCTATSSSVVISGLSFPRWTQIESKSWMIFSDFVETHIREVFLFYVEYFWNMRAHIVQRKQKAGSSNWVGYKALPGKEAPAGQVWQGQRPSLAVFWSVQTCSF